MIDRFAVGFAGAADWKVQTPRSSHVLYNSSCFEDLYAIDSMLSPQTIQMQQVRNVYIIDDDDLLLRALAHELNNGGFEVAGYTSGREFLQAFPDLDPGVILIDIRMPQISGLELQRRLISRGVCWPVIVMSAFPGTDGTVVAMKQGAFTVLDKPIQIDVLLDLMSQAFVELDRRCDQANDLPPELGGQVRYLDRLGERERAIIDQVYAGVTNRVIADEMKLSVKTVEKHRGRAMRKMQVKTFAQLIRLIDRELGISSD